MCLLEGFPPLCRDLHSMEGGGCRGDDQGHNHQTKPGHQTEGPQGDSGTLHEQLPLSSLSLSFLNYKRASLSIPPFIAISILLRHFFSHHPSLFHLLFLPSLSSSYSTSPGQDRDGNPRVTGEEWLVKKIGAYLPGAYEEVVELVDAYVLTEKVSRSVSQSAIHCV